MEGERHQVNPAANGLEFRSSAFAAGTRHGKERVATLTIHHGGQTFISHALAGGRSLAEVRDVAGHANVAITSGYLHVAVDEDAAVGDLFASTRGAR